MAFLPLWDSVKQVTFFLFTSATYIYIEIKTKTEVKTCLNCSDEEFHTSTANYARTQKLRISGQCVPKSLGFFEFTHSLTH